jgi:hypothetical protein
MCVFLAMSVGNAHEYHMDGRFSKQPEMMKLPLSCASAIAHLFASYPSFVAIDELPMPAESSSSQDDKADDEEEEEDLREQLVAALLEAKVIVVE